MHLVAYTLRPASADDVVFMRDTKFEGLRPYVEPLWGWSEDEQEERFRRTCDPEQSRIIVVDSSDVGWIQTVEDDDSLFVAQIFVTTVARRRGIGSAVLRDVLAMAGRLRKSVSLRVLKNNSLAQRLYERLGFSVTGETDSHILMRAARQQ